MTPLDGGYIKFQAESPSTYNDMPEHLSGYWWESSDLVCIPLVASQSPQVFLRFLRRCEGIHKPVFFPTVISGRLDTLLRRRGYVNAVTVSDEQGVVEGLLLIPKVDAAPDSEEIEP